MKKRLLSLALVLALAIALVPAAFAIPLGELQTTAGLYETVPPSPVSIVSDVYHVVGITETLGAIADRYGVAVKTIRDNNAAYFNKLATINSFTGNNVEVEAGANLFIKKVSETQDLVYTVQAGETLEGIAFNYYGASTAANVAKIRNANALLLIEAFGILEAGAQIVLPAAGLINPVTQNSIYRTVGMYLVKPGDTLPNIARFYYGNADAWESIYEANRDRVKLASGNAVIAVGQWLNMPE